MTRYIVAAGFLAVFGVGAASSQTLDNASLNGKYYFVHLQVDTSQGQSTGAQNISGTITFDGQGGFDYAASLGVDTAAASPVNGAGTYTLFGDGTAALTNPIRNTLQVIGGLSGDGNLLLGASPETSDATFDLFVALKAPADPVSEAVLNGSYTGASLQFPDGDSSAVKSAVVSLVAVGDGQFSSATVTGHDAGQGSRNVSQAAPGASYALNADGTGTANFGAGASLLGGQRDIFVSQDGSYLIGASTAAGGRDIFIAAKNFSTSATNASLSGHYWIAELTVERRGGAARFSAASGALNALGDGRLVIAERLHQDTTTLDFTATSSYLVNSDSTGNLDANLIEGVNNMALGGAVTVDGSGLPNSLVGAQIGPVDAVSDLDGVFFAVRAPGFSGNASFLNPNGVVNGASFAPALNPISPGSIVSLFGSGLAPRQSSAETLPLPVSLEDVSVTVNGVTAPLFFVSPGQVNVQAPFGLTGDSATIAVTYGGEQSNEVVVRLARSSPGIFAYADGQSPQRGVILHADYSLVTPDAPAQPGETVLIWLTGLGGLLPAVPTGAGNPGDPLSSAIDPRIQIWFGGQVADKLTYAGGAPFFAGLNQINAVIPTTVQTGTNIPVAISTSDAFSDLVDLPIGN
jgi:uncharacterized protein (TIGR03437 family)